MFGGVGLYADELFFALIADDAPYFKVDDGNRPDFEARGLEPFRPYGEHGEVMGYYRVAEDLLEDPEELRVWADKAVAAARRARRPKSRRRRGARKREAVVTSSVPGARMEPQLAPLAAILDLNSDLLLNTLDGLGDDDARARLPGGGNSLAFLAAHLIDTRHFLAERIGQPLANPVAPYLSEARSIEDIPAWPSLDELRRAWRAVSAHVHSALVGMSAADLQRPNADRFPLADGTQLGMIAFLVQHDSYHVGQMAFLRRQLGKPAMSYRRGAGARG
jgi:DNA transformation protein and related proteins